MARPNNKTTEELRGKRFGVTSIGGTLWMAAVLGLEHVGIDPIRDDIRFLVIGDQVVITQSLEQRRIDATVVIPFLAKTSSRRARIGRGQKTNLPITTTNVVAPNSLHPEGPVVKSSSSPW